MDTVWLPSISMSSAFVHLSYIYVCYVEQNNFKATEIYSSSSLESQLFDYVRVVSDNRTDITMFYNFRLFCWVFFFTISYVERERELLLHNVS